MNNDNKIKNFQNSSNRGEKRCGFDEITDVYTNTAHSEFVNSFEQRDNTSLVSFNHNNLSKIANHIRSEENEINKSLQLDQMKSFDDELNNGSIKVMDSDSYNFASRQSFRLGESFHFISVNIFEKMCNILFSFL